MGLSARAKGLLSRKQRLIGYSLFRILFPERKKKQEKEKEKKKGVTYLLRTTHQVERFTKCEHHLDGESVHFVVKCEQCLHSWNHTSCTLHGTRSFMSTSPALNISSSSAAAWELLSSKQQAMMHMQKKTCSVSSGFPHGPLSSIDRSIGIPNIHHIPENFSKIIYRTPLSFRYRAPSWESNIASFLLFQPPRPNQALKKYLFLSHSRITAIYTGLGDDLRECVGGGRRRSKWQKVPAIAEEGGEFLFENCE